MLNTMVFRAQFVHGLIEVGDFRRSVHQKQLPIPVGLLHDGVGHSMQELNRRLIQRHDNGILRLDIENRALLNLQLVSRSALAGTEPLIVIASGTGRLRLCGPLVAHQVRLRRQRAQERILTVAVRELHPDDERIDLGDMQRIGDLTHAQSGKSRIGVELFAHANPIAHGNLVALAVERDDIHIILRAFIAYQRNGDMAVDDVCGIEVIDKRIHNNM